MSILSKTPTAFYVPKRKPSDSADELRNKAKQIFEST